MPSDPEVLTLARAVLTKIRAEPWDSGRDNRAKKLPQNLKHAGTANIEENQSHEAPVPASQAIGRGTVGQQQNPGTAPGTIVGQQYTQPAHLYSRVLSALHAKCPSHLEIDRWQQMLADAEAFLARWGEQAQALGWTTRELLGLHTPAERPAASYQRFSRCDETGLIWLLQGRTLLAVTAETAAIQTASGGVLTYRKHNKPALQPVGDSLDDFDGVA